jgi:sugar phosphate permease
MGSLIFQLKTIGIWIVCFAEAAVFLLAFGFLDWEGIFPEGIEDPETQIDEFDYEKFLRFEFYSDPVDFL